MSDTGVLLVGFGGPDCLDAVGPFMCRLMGREPSEELVARVKTRYLAIGGASPLLEIAASMATEIGKSLADAGNAMPITVGMCYSDPFIGDALKALAESGCRRVITVSLSPFESKVAQQSYRDAVEKEAGPLGLEIVEAPLISTLPEYVDFFASATAASLEDLEPNEGAIIAFTAHSLPMEDLVEDDPYVTGLRIVASAVAERLGLEGGMENNGQPLFDSFHSFGAPVAPRPWFLVFQSKGNKPGDWLGPSLDELIEACSHRGIPAIAVVPIGFVTDHMETLWDLDIEAADKAIELGVEFIRAPVPNDNEFVIEAIAQAIASI